MSGFNLPPGVTTLPGEEIIWEEQFEDSEEFAGLPREAKKRWENAGKPLSKLFGAIMGWAWARAEAEAGMSNGMWLDLHAIPQAAAELGIAPEAIHEALYRKAGDPKPAATNLLSDFIAAAEDAMRYVSDDEMRVSADTPFMVALAAAYKKAQDARPV